MPDATADDPEIDAPARPSRRRWGFRVSLRGLMILVVLIGGPLGWAVRQATLRRRAVAEVQALRGRMLYEDQLDSQGFFRRPHAPGGPAWLRRIVGDELFEEVAGVVFDLPGGRLGVDDESIAVVNNFPRLRRLTIQMHGGNVDGGPPPRRITAEGLARLTGVPHLRELSLYRLQVDAALVRLLPRWPDLEEIVIIEGERRTLDPACLAILGALSKLRKVQIASLAAPRAEDLAPVLKLDHLERLWITKSPRDDAGVARLGSVPSLTSLDLPRTAFSDATLAALARNPNLVTLGFDGSRLGPGALRALGGLTRLSDLTINLGDRSSEPNAQYLIHRVPARFGDADLDALSGLPLTSLTIMGLDATDAGVARLLAGRNFTHLALSGRGVTDATIALLGGQARLESLALAETGITDTGVAQLACLPALRYLALVDNPTVTDAGMASLRTLPKLEYLTFRQPGTRPATIEGIRAGRPRFNFSEPPAEEP